MTHGQSGQAEGRQRDDPGERGRERWREIGASVAALAGFYVLAALYLRPIWRTWRTSLSPNQTDPLFVLYLLKWVGRELGRHFAGYWEAPFFFPTHDVLAFSDHMLGPGLVATAWNALVPGWVGAYNMLYLSAFAVTAWTLTWVLRRSGRGWPAALLGGALYAFCPFRWDQQPHLQVLMMAAIPLVWWTCDRLLAAPSWRRAAAFLLCYAVHLSGGCYLAVMMHVPLLALAANRLLGRGRTRPGRRELAILLATAVAAAGMFAALFLEYWRVSKHYKLAWAPDTGRHWGASLLSYLQPASANFYSALLPARLWRPENSLFPGWLALALCIAGLVLWRRDGRLGSPVATLMPPMSATPASPMNPPPLQPPQPIAGPHAAWLLVPLALVLGGWGGGEALTWTERRGVAAPSHLALRYGLAALAVVAGGALWALLCRKRRGRWPWAALAALPAWPRGVLLAGAVTALSGSAIFYVPLAKVVPGFSAMRVPARFQAFTMVAVAYFAAAAFDAFAARLGSTAQPLRAGAGAGSAAPGRRWRVAVFTAAVLLVAAAELVPKAVPWTEIEEEADFPDVYEWLADQPDVQAVLELPMNDPDLDPLGPASIRAMYYGTLDWRPRVNGYSAHFPQHYIQLLGACNPMPDAVSLAALKTWGVTHIIVHRFRLPLVQRQALARWDFAHPTAILYAGDGDRVYRVEGGRRRAAGG